MSFSSRKRSQQDTAAPACRMEDAGRRPHAFKQHSYELSILNEVARALNASVDLSTLLARALEKVAELLDLHTGWVLLFDETTGEPQLAAAQNLPPGLHQEPERMTGWCYCLESFFAGRLDDAANIGVVTCSRLRKLALAQGDTAGLRFHASIPLTVYVGDAATRDTNCDDNRIKRLGILNVVSPEWRQLTDDELRLLYTIGDMLSVAVERARLHARRLDAVQAEERNRLAREIHDTIAQDLSAIAFQLEAVEALLDQQAGPERIRRSITAALDLTRKGLDETRRSVLDLRAAPLEGRTLAEALTALAAQTETAHGVPVATETAAMAHTLPPAVEVGLYRIAQEALQNALRHADATAITLRLDGTNDHVCLCIEDDGQGFDLDTIAEAHASNRFGLVGMRERARLLGGRLQIESTPGLGTRITADVPLAV